MIEEMLGPMIAEGIAEPAGALGHSLAACHGTLGWGAFYWRSIPHFLPGQPWRGMTMLPPEMTTALVVAGSPIARPDADAGSLNGRPRRGVRLA